MIAFTGILNGIDFMYANELLKHQQLVYLRLLKIIIYLRINLF